MAKNIDSNKSTQENFHKLTFDEAHQMTLKWVIKEMDRID